MWEETTIKVDFIIYVKPSHMLCIQVQNKWKYLIISCQKVFVKDRMCIEGGVEQMLTKGGGGVGQKMTIADEGGRGG